MFRKFIVPKFPIVKKGGNLEEVSENESGLEECFSANANVHMEEKDAGESGIVKEEAKTEDQTSDEGRGRRTHRDAEGEREVVKW